jgi:hypothetical protein
VITQSDLKRVARELKKRLGNRAFQTLQRLEVTELLRTLSGEDSTRIKSVIGQNLEQALLEQGVRIFPSFSETNGADSIRLFHAGTVMSDFVDMLRHPSPNTDRELAGAIKKFKGKYVWDRGETPVEGSLADEADEWGFRPARIRGKSLASTVLAERR